MTFASILDSTSSLKLFSFEIFLLGALAGLFLPKLLEQIAAVRLGNVLLGALASRFLLEFVEQLSGWRRTQKLSYLLE